MDVKLAKFISMLLLLDMTILNSLRRMSVEARVAQDLQHSKTLASWETGTRLTATQPKRDHYVLLSRHNFRKAVSFLANGAGLVEIRLLNIK